jgi:hypothetical protein
MKRMEGVTMSKFAIAAAAIALAVAGVAFAAGIDSGDDDRGLRTASSTTTTGGTTTTEDRADDRNRRGHKAKKGKQNRRGKAHQARRRDRVREAGQDVRGPCDEAEHANDPRCTGAAPDRDDHDSGRGRSGGNSGPG